MVKQCEECKHWTGSIWTEHCRACCFGSKYEKKREEPRAIYISTARGGGKVDELVKQLMKNYQYGSKAYLDTDDVESMYPREIARMDHLDALYYGSKAWRDTMQLFMDKHDYVRKTRIENVIFNDPATIVFWADGTKTVVKATDETFDPEKGLAMAISKKALGNQGNYYEEFKKWIPEQTMRKLPEIDEAHLMPDCKSPEQIRIDDMKTKFRVFMDVYTSAHHLYTKWNVRSVITTVSVDTKPFEPDSLYLGNRIVIDWTDVEDFDKLIRDTIDHINGYFFDE